jgi:hypothetical protein
LTPLSKDEIVPYSPASLSNVAAAPAFLFRPATKRDARAFERLCIEEGLMLHQDAEIRAEYRAALQALYTPQEAEDATIILNGLWEKLDQGIPADESEIDAALDLMETLKRHHRPLRIIVADNSAFFQTAPLLALSLFLVGWKNVDLEFRRIGGTVPIELLIELEPVLAATEKAAIADKVAGIEIGSAYMQIQTYALDLLHTTRAEAGKSPSLSPPPSIQNGSVTDGSPAATSPALSTKTTRRGTSRKPTAA